MTALALWRPLLATGRHRTHVVRQLPGRGKRGAGYIRITITAIRFCSRASDISEGDAQAEGFATAEEFRAVYGRLNGAKALDQACWALTFAVVSRNRGSGAGHP